MKKRFALVMVMIFIVSAAGMSTAELRPLSKVMVYRLAQMTKLRRPILISKRRLKDFHRQLRRKIPS